MFSGGAEPVDTQRKQGTDGNRSLLTALLRTLPLVLMKAPGPLIWESACVELHVSDGRLVAVIILKLTENLR